MDIRFVIPPHPSASEAGGKPAQGKDLRAWSSVVAPLRGHLSPPFSDRPRLPEYPDERMRAGYLANSESSVAKPLISTALPDGSKKNMVPCSPASPLKRT